MRYLVLGAGALGGYFGGRLLKGGADVTFLVRPGRAAQLQRDGLVVKAQDGDIRQKAKVVQAGQIEAPYDVVLLTCKAYDLDDALRAVAPAMGPDSAILPLLNGVRHIDVLKDRFGPERVLGGLTAVNAALLPDGTIQQSPLKVDMNIIGELGGALSQRCASVRDAFARGGLPIVVSETIMAMMWAKFAAFASIAAIASLTRSRAGAIARSAHGAQFVSAATEEAWGIATAEGFPPPPDNKAIVRGMYAQPDSGYGPSLLVDMENGRPTEGEHTIGDMVARAARHGVAAPILGAALCNLQAYEINRTKKPI